MINARTDVFLGGGAGTDKGRLAEATRRAGAYLEAGADCIYPILLSDLTGLRQMLDSLGGAPLNVFASADAPAPQTLEEAGIARLSLGPGLLRAALSAMRDVATGLRTHGSYEAFTRDAITGAEIEAIVSPDEMP